MHALIEFIAGVVALLAAAAFAQFGVDVNSASNDQPEVRRVSDCGEKHSAALIATAPATDDC